MKTLGIIIPTFNEAANIGQLCSFLIEQQKLDRRLRSITIVDAKSTDKTVELIDSIDTIVITSDVRSRAYQLNLGAQYSGDIDVLYFVHADVLPPKGFIDMIFTAIELGNDFGCFSYQFNHPSKLLKINSRFTRKKSMIIGGGDQTLFMKRLVFEELGGYREDHLIMEDYELYWRANKKYRSTIIVNDAIVSARKYINNSYLRVQLANFIIFNGYKLGVSQQKLARWYRKLLN